MKQYRARSKREAQCKIASQFTEDALIMIGEWLFLEEIQALNREAFKRIAASIQKDISFASGESNVSLLSVKEKMSLMVNVLLICFINLGGQRRQFIAGMTTVVSKF